MTPAQFEARAERAENGTLVVSKTEEGFRVYSIHNPSHVYLVRQEGDRWTCTCPDFEYHKLDTTWRCKHILAAAPWQKQEGPAPAQPSNGQSAELPSSPLAAEPPDTQKKRTRKNSDGSAQMLIKRSVSPDGRIDSVSVEFSMPVSDRTENEIKAKALTTLQLQREIVTSFLKLNGHAVAAAPPPTNPPAPANGGNGSPVFARMVDIGKMNGRWGERLFITFSVNGRNSRLFGSPKQLAEHIQAAGYDIDEGNIEPGLRLNLACRVTTKPSEDGKYQNVDKVFPVAQKGGSGGGNGNAIPY